MLHGGQRAGRPPPIAGSVVRNRSIRANADGVRDVLGHIGLDLRPCRSHAEEVVWMTVTMIREAPVELPTAEPLIELVGVEKVYRTGKLEYPALRGVDL